jgi:2-methylisocitrate lyase-like PEP mutase family enzyme
MNQQDRAKTFRQLHTQRPLVLPNAWDAASARVIEQAGAAAIATTSAGVAWSYGHVDGQRLQRNEMIDVIRRIIQTVAIPVTADIEGGYGEGSIQDVIETVHAVLAAGAVGINLEDSPGQAGSALLAAEVHAERIQAARSAARAAGIDLVINARTDVYLLQVGAPETRLAEAIRRANLYRAAGADCLFVPGVIDAATITALVQSLNGPLNIMAMPGAPSIAQLGQLGVARVSLGPALAQRALAMTQRAAHELLTQGTYQTLEQRMPISEINQLFR